MTAGTLTSVYGGASNTVSGTGTAILGGWSNAASGLYSVLVGGEKGAAQGQYSVALGGASTADTAKDAVAIGIGASANVEKGVAIGAGAVATEAGTISVGHNKGDKYYQTSYTVNGGGTVKEQTYSSNLYNRLVNVGYGKDGHDAATMDQLTKVSAGDRISVASETDQTTGAATYKISVNNDGAVASGDANLVAGGTVYSEVRPSSDGTYVKTASTTGDNLLALDGQVKSNADNISTNTSNIASNATDIRNLKDLSNITADGQTVIKNLAKDAVKVVAGTNTTVTEGTDGDAKTYAVNVADADIKKAVQQDLDGKANVDASNVTDENVGKWQSKLGNGALASGNTGLVTGGTVYAYETPTKLAGQTEFKYVQTDYTTGQNLAALDKGVSDNATDITNLSEKVANIKVGKTQLADGTNTTVTSETDTTTDTTTWKVNVSKDAIKDAVKEDLSGKANVDASNLTDENVTRWQSKLGNGTIASSNIGLVTGGTVYSEVRPSSDGTYVKTASTTGDNLLALDGQVKSNADNISTNTSNIASNATDIRNLKDLSNITADGQTVIKKAAVGAITVKAGDRVEVQMEKATDGSSVTYTVSAKNDGKVAKDDANLVSGDTVYNAIEDAKNAIDTDMDTKVSNKADIDASNVGKNLKGDDGSTAASDDAIQQNLNAWGSAVGTGTIDKNNGQLVTGGTVYTEVRPKEDGTYVKMASTTGDNLLALDKQVSTNAKNITDLTNLTNITDAGKTVIKNLAKGTIDMENGSYTTVSSREVDGVKTFKVDVASDGKVEEGNSGLVTGDTVAKAIKDETRVSEDGTYVKKDATAGENLKNLDDQVKKNTDNITSIKNITDNLDNNYAKTDLSNVTDEGKTTIKNLAQDAVKVVNGKNTTVTTKTETNGNISYAVNVDDSAIKDVMKEDMDKKADRDAGNLTDSDVTSWQKKLGTGESQSGDHRLISGDTLYNALKEVDGNTLMKTDGVTINIDQTGTAKTIDVRGKDGVTRTITGIATDPSDPTSAANVDYVDHRVESLNSRMTHEVSRAGAGAAALAALHPLEWDPDSKFEFALGYGHYKAANAAALGLFYRPNEDVMYNLGGTLGNGDAMMSGGVTFRFGTKGRKPKASPLAMQQTIMDQNAKIEHQDEMLKIQANKIDSLEKELLDLKRLITQK